MKESSFIKQTINNWNNEFPYLHIRYAYEENVNYHIIEVSPENDLNSNQAFRKRVFDFWNAFSERFPMSDLIVSEPDDTYNMTNILYDNKVDYMLSVKDFKETIDYIFYADSYHINGTRSNQLLEDEIDYFLLAA